MLAKFSVAPPRSLLQQPPVDPTRIQFRSIADSAALGKVDKATGRIPGVSLLTGDREAAGWGIWVDQKTIESFHALLGKRKIKAYATHGSWGKDGTLDEVGYWELPRIDGNQLREDFVALDAWRKHSEAEFDTLFELAEKLPEEFGASLAFRFRAVWVQKGGTEVETVRKWRYIPDEGYEEYWEPSMPADAERDMPSVRAVEVYSADFVDQPAANDGLFQTGPGAVRVDGKRNGNSSASTQPAQLSMIKELYAKFSGNPAQLTSAIALHTQNDKLSFAEICSGIENEAQLGELKLLREKNTLLGKFNERLEQAGFKAAGEKSALDALLAEHGQFKTKATSLDTAEAALKAAGFEAKDGKTATELALAAHKKLAADIATLRVGGHVAIETGVKPGEGKDTAQLSGLAKVKAAFEKKPESN